MQTDLHSHGTENRINCRVALPSGRANFFHDQDGRFTIIAAGTNTIERLLHLDAYSAAKAFVEGSLSVHGDLFEAVRFFSNRRQSALRDFWLSSRAHLNRLGIQRYLWSRGAAARNIRFHYDRSTAFYRQFLDPRMQYSSAHFSRSQQTLEKAQIEKLNRICDALNLRDGDRLLDIGCGWGGLLVYVAEQYRVTGTGCTISHEQYVFADKLSQNPVLDGRVTIEELDYRDLAGSFDKIVSVGMFEHVGHNHLASYFRKINHLLGDKGLFLNRGIVRPEGVSDGPDTLFLQEAVFPGGELVHLSDVVREAERAGFKVIRMEEFGRHYATTCRRWVQRLQDGSETCRRLVDEETYRTWLLYLAASAVSFEDGGSGAAQLLMEKRTKPFRT